MNTDPVRPRVTTKHEAVDSHIGMSLDDLARFVQEAMRVGHDGSTVVKARVTLGGRIRHVEVTGATGLQLPVEP